MFGFTIQYFAWHFGRSISDYLRIWTNLLWFFWHLFSFELLTKTFFMPFRRITEKPVRGFYPDKWLEQFAVNVLMRLVGMIVRLFVLLIGTIMLLATVVFGLIFLIVWIFSPILCAMLFAGGLVLLIS